MVAAFDTEDNSAELLAAGQSGWRKKLTRGCGIDAAGNVFLTSATGEAGRREMLQWLSAQQGRVYAHNLRYDLGNLFADALDELAFSMVGGRIITARWNRLVFYDSFNIWPMALAKIGAALGLEKKTMDVHGEDYVRRDVEICRQAMLLAMRFASEYGIDAEHFPATLGGLTVKIWRALGGRNWFCASDLARAAYYGGRVELFSNGGRGRIFYTDVNSMYPWAMTQPFPDDALPWAGLPENEARSLRGWGVASVIMDIPKTRIAPLPVRREDGSIYYPWGRVRGVWTLHELRHAIAHGAKLVDFVSVSGGAPMVGSQTASHYYRDYIERMYQRRLQAKTEAEKLFFKLLMNNLYGQLAVRGKIDTTLSLEHCVSPDGRLLVDGVPFGTKVLAKTEFPLPEHTNFLHAAYITAYGRLRLLDFLRRIPEENLIYCDTDSVIFWCREKNPPFPLSAQLGEMKLEAEITRCQVLAPKVYRWSGKKTSVSKAKGVPHKKAPDGRWLADVYMDDGVVQFAQPFGLRESIIYYDYTKTHGEKGEHSRKLSVWRMVEKRAITKYDKKTFKKGYFFPKKYVDKNVSI